MSDTHKIEVSRRGFLKGAGLTAATTVIESASALAHEAQEAMARSSVWSRRGCRSNYM